MSTFFAVRGNAGRQRWQVIMFGMLRLAAGINMLALVGVCAFLIWNGSPAISWEFLSESPRRMMTEGGIWPCIVGTFLLAFGSMLIAFPLGVASAVYLNEYGSRKPWTRYLRLGISNLAGVPSVVFGLFGLAFFVTFLGMGVSLLAGMLTLAVLTLPVIINTTEEALRQVPDAWREASLALGATRSQTIARVVLPAAVPGHADRSHSGTGPRRWGNGGHHVHGSRLLYASHAGFDIQFGDGSAVSHVCSGHGGNGNRKNTTVAVRNRSGVACFGARHESCGHHRS